MGYSDHQKFPSLQV